MPSPQCTATAIFANILLTGPRMGWNTWGNTEPGRRIKQIKQSGGDHGTTNSLGLSVSQ